MKTNFFLLIVPLFCSSHLFSQVKAVRPLVKKTVVTTSATKPITNPKPVKTENQLPTDLYKANISFVCGENGKSTNTILVIEIDDSKQLKAADYSEVGLTIQVEDDRYYGHTKRVPYVPQFSPGENESLSAQLDASELQRMELIGIQPSTVTRYAVLSDFVNGGSISIAITPKTVYPLIGPDTWNIKSFTVNLSFDNDPASPHKMTWNGFTLSPTATSRTLKFDKNFSPVQ